MIVPTITAFKQALSSPHTHFVMLKQIEPVLQNGQIIVNHTTLAAECKVRLNGTLYMMYMPFSYQTTQRIAELDTKMHNIDSSIICHNKIYYNEVLVKRTTDKAFYCDIIMQQIPEGRSMVEAMGEYSSSRINSMIHDMSEELNRIGFAHNHLSPENIIISNQHRMYPIRYWYATFKRSALDQYLPLYQYAMDNDGAEYIAKSRTNGFESVHQSQTELYYDGLIHFYHHKCIGFKDKAGNEVIPPQYRYATHFLEGRAIVAKRVRMGVINKSGEEVIPIVFEKLNFDISRHIFIGIKEGRIYSYHYNGKLLHTERCDSKVAGGGYFKPRKETIDDNKEYRQAEPFHLAIFIVSRFTRFDATDAAQNIF